MTTPLRKVREVERTSVALRRYHGKTGGLGFLAARDYLIKTGQMPDEKPIRLFSGDEKPRRKPKKAQARE